MGIHSPQALINTLWSNNCLHFGLQGQKEQQDLNWGDILSLKQTVMPKNISSTQLKDRQNQGLAIIHKIEDQSSHDCMKTLQSTRVKPYLSI